MDDHHVRLDTTQVFSARVYNYWLGGKDNFAADREYGDAVAKTSPNIRTAAIENRRFLGRAVAVLAEAGIRQFLDIGTGLPTAGNTHEVAQEIAPESRIVYVDNDPMVMVHARALLTSSPQGKTAYIEGDVRDPDTFLTAAELRDTLDLAQPVALMLIAVLHFVADEVAYRAVDTLLKQLAPGSYVVISHATGDFWDPARVAEVDATNKAHRMDFRFRSRAEFARFFGDLPLIGPGIVPVSQWRADGEPTAMPEDANIWAAVARVP
jgi:O-methyltransferase involved in polyketide biosynthesis